MHSTVLGISGYVLLLSSLVSLVALFKKSFKHCVKTPIHVLSTSDVLSSVVTAVILLVNQSRISNVLQNDGGNSSEAINLPVLLEEGREEEYRRAHMDFHRMYNYSNLEESALNGTTNTASCNPNEVLMHYAMFLVPFANAFLSLLHFTMQFCLKIPCMKRATTLLPTKKAESAALNIPEDTRLTKLKSNEKKIISLGMIVQWIVPLLLTGILQFFNYQDMRRVRHLEDMECVFTTNFPFESCQAFTNAQDLHSTDSRVQMLSGVNNYIEVGDLDRIPSPDSKEVDEIVSKVQKLVHLTLNETYDVFNETEFHDRYNNFSDLWNITKYTDNSHIQGGNLKIEPALKQHGNNRSVSNYQFSNVAIPQREVDQKEEWKLFEDVMEESTKIIKMNTSSEYPLKNITEHIVNSQAKPPLTNSPLYPLKVTSSNTLSLSKNDIYADIVKRIRNITTQLKTQKRKKIHRNNTKDTTVHSKLNVYLLNDGEVLDDSIFSFQNGSSLRRARENNYSYNTGNTGSIKLQPVCMKSRCFLSTKFLKMHMLVLLFLIYFIPILISCLLLIRSEYECEGILKSLEAKKIEASVAESASSTEMGNSTVSGWFLAAHKHGNAELNAPELEDHSNRNSDVQSTSKIESSLNVQTVEHELHANIFKETEGAKGVFKTLKKSLLLGILMWTPIFLEILAKVFLCASAPNWLTSGLFLFGTSFGVIRNIFNLDMIKTQEICYSNKEKDNSVHPSTRN